MISQTAEYALRAIVHIAADPSRSQAAREVAKATGVPAAYLSKILNALVGAGVVRGQRGPNGGFALARPASAITVLDVINAVDPIQRIRECPIKNPDHVAELCPLHRRLDEAIAHVEQVFADSVITEMMDHRANCPGLAATAPADRAIDEP